MGEVINRYLNRIKAKINKIAGLDWVGKLDDIQNNINLMEKMVSPKKIRILMGPSFVSLGQAFALDRSLSMAFQLRGIEVIPIYCDSIQNEVCQFVGGDWNEKGKFARDCRTCKKTSEKLWKNNQNKPLQFSKYLTSDDIERIGEEVSVLKLIDVLSYERSGIAYGAMAKDILINKYLVSNHTLIENHVHLMKVHLQNLLMVSLVYERILDEKKPDRVVAHDSYYGMLALLELHCRSRSIPFYSHWPVTKNRVAFAFNDAAMNLDFTKSWGEFSKIELTSEDYILLNKWFKGDRAGFIDTTKLAGHEVDDHALDNINPLKPTIVLAGNVIWDLCTLNKDIIFKDMISWIAETIEWFRINSEYQLIIRPHPAETSPIIPKTRETIEAALHLLGTDIPENVFLLKSDAKVTIKDLIKSYDIRGFAVYTTTVGFEYAALGFHVITTGKSCFRGFGFTTDPVTKQEYFTALENLLVNNKMFLPESNQILAKKFIKFYWFHYYSNIGLFSGDPPVLAANYLELLQSEQGPFSYIVNSIIDGVPINGENRWIPVS